MAKLAILAAIFAAVVVVSYAHRTTVAVDIDEDTDNPQRWQEGRGCREQLQRAQELNRCEQLIREQAYERAGGRSRRRDRMEEELMECRHFQPCCQQLRQMRNEQCRCEGLREIVRRQQQQQGRFGGGEGFEFQEVVESARNLPSLCGVGPQRCEIRAGWF